MKKCATVQTEFADTKVLKILTASAENDADTLLLHACEGSRFAQNLVINGLNFSHYGFEQNVYVMSMLENLWDDESHLTLDDRIKIFLISIFSEPEISKLILKAIPSKRSF